MFVWTKTPDSIMIVHLDYENMALYSYSFLDSNQATAFISTHPTRKPISFRPEIPHRKKILASYK